MTNKAEGFKGSCLCGQATYSCTVGPARFLLCYCKDCQIVSGGAPGSIAVVSKGSVTVSGELKSYTKAGDSGNKVTRKFCPDCGTHVFSEPEAAPDMLVVKAGTMSNAEQLQPAIEVWVKSALPWHARHMDIPHLEEQ